MLIFLTTLLATLSSTLRSRAALELENLALRHQIGVLQRSVRKRPKLTPVDRLLWAWLSHIWSDWRSALAIVQPETVIAWHRKSFRLFWAWKIRRGRPGRPTLTREIRDLIHRMSREPCFVTSLTDWFFAGDWLHRRYTYPEIWRQGAEARAIALTSPLPFLTCGVFAYVIVRLGLNSVAGAVKLAVAVWLIGPLPLILTNAAFMKFNRVFVVSYAISWLIKLTIVAVAVGWFIR